MRITRVSGGSNCTLSAMTIDVVAICVALERPWVENKKCVSCIPTGVYDVVPYSSKKYTNVYEVINVPNRSKILIHIGNFPKDTKGCILPGLAFGVDSVAHSTKAMNKIRSIIGNEKFKLTIVEAY